MEKYSKDDNVVTAVEIPLDYKPSDNEEFMNLVMLEYFRKKLLTWRNELLSESNVAVKHMKEINESKIIDDVDHASMDVNLFFELRTRDRARKLISKIDKSLIKIDEGTYGYCIETGEPIGVKRLDARPIAIYSVHAQEMHEREEKLYKK